MRILLTKPFNPEKHKTLESIGVDLFVVDEASKVDKTLSETFDGLIGVNPFSSLNIDISNLKWIQLLTVGIEQLPESLAERNDLIVTNMRGVYSVPIAEWVICKVLDICKNSRAFFERQRTKKWQFDRDIVELSNKKALIIGTGSVGCEIAKRIKPFVTVVAGSNTNGHAVDVFDKCFPLEKIDCYVGEFDIIVIALPLTKSTSRIVSDDFFQKIKRGSIFVNVSRGGIVDEMALSKCLNEDRFRGIALDVFENEPLAVNNPLWIADKAILTPHNSWFSDLIYERRFEVVYKNVECFVQNKTLHNVVNINRGY